MPSKSRPIFLRPSVFIVDGNADSARGVRTVYADEKNSTLLITFSDNSEEKFAVSDITQGSNTARMAFVSNGVRNTVRGLRETDGRWLSVLKTDLPLEALEEIINRGDAQMDTGETLEAFALEDSPYVVGLVLTNARGRWTRQDGDWMMLAPRDETFSADNMISISINPDRANDYIALYDSNFVSVTDTEQYESADSDTESGQSDD